MVRAFLIALIFAATLSFPAQAEGIRLSLDDCNNRFYDPGTYGASEYTSKVVACTRNSIIEATYYMMNQLSIFMLPIVTAMLVIAVAVFGIRILGGEESVKTGMGFIFRFALVWVFFFNLGGYAWAVFDITDSLVMMVSLNGVNPWQMIDRLLGQLFGFLPEMTIAQGLMGVVGAGLYSSTVGAVMFLAGFSAIMNLLLFIFRVVFVYLMSITVIAFLLVISPFVIPMAIFFYTKRYFIRWLDTLFSAMLVPILLFAFLTFFIYAFTPLVNDIYKTLCGDECASNPELIDFSAFQKEKIPKFGFVIPSSPEAANRMIDTVGATSVGKPPVQSNITPTLRRAHDAGFAMPGVDFGPDNVSIMQNLVYSFAALWIFASFMKSMVDKIPEIASNIANAASGITMQPTSVELTVKRNWNKLQSAITGRGT